MSGLAAFSRDVSELVARAAPAVVGVEHAQGQGSGVVIAPDGWVLTNAHVVRGGGPVRVRLSGARAVAASLAGADDRTDLAVLRAEARDLPSLPLSERRLEAGEVVVAIGNPLGFERSVTVGVVSALHRNLPGRGGALEGLVQTDASINPGNSGGPLLDATGQVVGISTAIIPWARGLGFAVPAHTASWVASVLMRDGAVRRPVLGIAARGEDLEPELRRASGLARGIRVLEVIDGSAAQAAGLRKDDLLLGVEGSPVQTLDDLQRAMALSPEAELRLDLQRGDARRALTIRPRRAAA